jgi:hypothetical protein
MVLSEVRWSTYDDTHLLQLGYEGVSSAAVALSLAPRSLTAEGAVFFADAKNPARAPARANARLAQSIFLYFEALGSPALSNTFPLRCNRSRSFVSSCISDPAAHARPDEAAPGTPMADDLLLASSCQRQRTSQNLVFKPRRSHDPNRSLLRSNRLGPPI